MDVKLIFKNELFVTNEQKQAFAQLASKTLGDDQFGFEPYRPNDWDWDFWTIDNGTDFKVKFWGAREVQFVHRYEHRRGKEITDELIVLGLRVKSAFGQECI